MRKPLVFLVASGLLLIVVACWAAASTGFLFAGGVPVAFIPPAAGVAFPVAVFLFVIALAVTIDDIVTTRLRTRPAESPTSENGLEGAGNAGPEPRGSGTRALLAVLLVAAAL